MKESKRVVRFAGIISIAIVASVGSVSGLFAAEQTDAQPKPTGAKRLFASPDEAIKALQAAAEAKDDTLLQNIFGPEIRDLQTGDKVQDAANARRFAAAMAQACNPLKEGDARIIVEVGTNGWPMPIPLVKADGHWHFDTAAGKDEIINRHIGKDELHAIGVCRAYVAAQRQYASLNAGMGGRTNYAQRFKSTSGAKDGLFWPTADNEPTSPFGPLVAKAHIDGYGNHIGSGSQPFHGYYFRILTRQGAAASAGKRNYIQDGNLAGGFALVAYPENWDRSGIMTFIVNQDGNIYQRNLGEKTCRIAGEMKEYNPDDEWTLVQDLGVLSAVSEK